MLQHIFFQPLGPCPDSQKDNLILYDPNVLLKNQNNLKIITSVLKKKGLPLFLKKHPSF